MTSASIYNAINWLSPLQFATLTTINILIGFMGVLQLSENDSRFVTRTEWLDNNIKVDEKIDKVDRKHTDALNNLSIKVERKAFYKNNLLKVKRNQKSI